jgi:hypothetical protein
MFPYNLPIFPFVVLKSLGSSGSTKKNRIVSMLFFPFFCNFKLIAVNSYCGNERGRGGGVAVVQELSVTIKIKKLKIYNK